MDIYFNICKFRYRSIRKWECKYECRYLFAKEEYKLPLNEYVISQYTGTQGENGLYYHDSSLANGAGDNSYRYAGPSDTTNNFVCFGSDAATCPTDNLYRIIGVFGENNHGVSGQQLVKLIKYDYAKSALLGTSGDYSGSVTPNATYYKGSLASIDEYFGIKRPKQVHGVSLI